MLQSNLLPQKYERSRFDCKLCVHVSKICFFDILSVKLFTHQIGKANMNRSTNRKSNVTQYVPIKKKKRNCLQIFCLIDRRNVDQISFYFNYSSYYKKTLTLF